MRQNKMRFFFLFVIFVVFVTTHSALLGEEKEKKKICELKQEDTVPVTKENQTSILKMAQFLIQDASKKNNSAVGEEAVSAEDKK